MMLVPRRFPPEPRLPSGVDDVALLFCMTWRPLLRPLDAGEVAGVMDVWMSVGTSTEVRKRTWPVWPWAEPVGLGTSLRDEVEAVIFGRGNVRTTPALVPTHNRSLHTRRAVILRQAALCWRIIASEPDTENKKKIDLWRVLVMDSDKSSRKTRRMKQYKNYNAHFNVKWPLTCKELIWSRKMILHRHQVNYVGSNSNIAK